MASLFLSRFSAKLHCLASEPTGAKPVVSIGCVGAHPLTSRTDKIAATNVVTGVRATAARTGGIEGSRKITGDAPQGCGGHSRVRMRAREYPPGRASVKRPGWPAQAIFARG